MPDAALAGSLVESSPSPGDSLVPPSAGPAGDMKRRVARLLLLRTLVITGVLGLSLWMLIRDPSSAHAALWLQSSIIFLTYFSSIVFGVLLIRGVSPQRVVRP